MKQTRKFMMLLVLIMTAPSITVAAEHNAHQQHQAAAAPKYTPKSAQVKRAQIDVLLTKPEQLLIIDLRRPDEISKIGGFPAYLNIQADQLENSLAFIPKDRTIVTVSNHAGRSGKSADLLTEKGFKVAGYLGAQYYEEEGGKLTKVAVPAPKPAAKKH
ncbi:MAG: rhodanese-like domain-containing protein [Methylococcales bacterium]